jgi:hypothetical protein
MNVEVLRVDGTRELHVIGKHNAIRTIHRLIGCETGDSVNLRDGRVMCVDDTGLNDGKPINKQATELYWSIYPLAKKSQQPIAGDVAIALDEDFA